MVLQMHKIIELIEKIEEKQEQEMKHYNMKYGQKY